MPSEVSELRKPIVTDSGTIQSSANRMKANNAQNARAAAWRGFIDRVTSEVSNCKASSLCFLTYFLCFRRWVVPFPWTF